MKRTALWFSTVVAAVVAVTASGCVDPYVYKRAEFDRGDKNFNKPITDRTEVTICFNGVGTTDKHVANMAQEECGKFGKIAHPVGEGFGACPLFAPVEAHFACVASEAESPSDASPTVAPQPPVSDQR